MGNDESSYKATQYKKNYNFLPTRDHLFFGRHQLLLHQKDQNKFVICKGLIFQSDSEYQQFMDAFQSVARKPFSIVYPRDILDCPAVETCSTTREVKVYFDIVGETLLSEVQKEGLFSEVKGWFLLNQLSKALEVLEENGRSHLAVSPESVYRNTHGNYLLYDSLFVLGSDPTSFLKEASMQGAPLTSKLSKILDRHSYPSREEAKEQDMYTVGLVLFYVFTGISVKKLPPEPARSLTVAQILRETNVSREMKHMITSLIEAKGLRRMDNNQLRRLLKDKESFIIKGQTMEFRNSKVRSSVTYVRSQEIQRMTEDERRYHYEQNRQTNLNPPLFQAPSMPSKTTLYRSYDPSMANSEQQSISNHSSRKIYHTNNQTSSLSINYFPSNIPPKLVRTPQKTRQSYHNEPFLSKIRSAGTLPQW